MVTALPAEHGVKDTYQRFTKAEGAWHYVDVSVPSILKSLAGSPGTLYFTHVPPDTETITLGKYRQGQVGRAIFEKPGRWYFQSAGAATETYILIPVTEAALMSLIAVMEGMTEAVNVGQIGGTSQSGVDVAARFNNITMAAPTAGSVGVASAELVAASATRRFLYLRNTDSTDRVSLGFGAAAVLDSGMTLDPGEWVSFGPLNDITVQAVNAIAAAAATPVGIQTGT